ncbi:B-cell lymphoma/leukemia 11A [Daktulosphaira vitifoliae]|uniref:B-cell lymphoma/leukemia 11A n=1 Tax=Daktulosphaira vitifoliae TaxID=58002 RepID=UPI0021AA3B28|nr:B-cell lymphoma/leukemia 11A [Daktulosphaira vitifoliae]
MNTDFNPFRMTMDIHRTVASSPSYSPTEMVTSLPLQRPQKRSFDVAFLMAPDDLSKRRSRSVQAAATVTGSHVRSAFTKVVSPDLGALSPTSSSSSPPIITPPPELGYHQDSLSPPLPPQSHFMTPFSMGFRAPPFMMLPPRPHPKDSYPPSPAPLQFAPAAALPAMLLPASIAAAALTLPSQNVCAKCNVSFRMTSDLVYHMRSHHKSDGSGAGSSNSVGMTDTKKRRDMDKLRCPVCDESFRERHHLTRHMTAHQDKEGDRLDDEDEPQHGAK